MSAAVQREGHRKPIQFEMIGGKCARQRIWEEMRKTPDAIRVLPIAQYANAEPETVKTYIQCLVAGKYVEVVHRGHLEKSLYKLVKDSGIESPRLTRKGTPVKQGQFAEAMWRTLRILGSMDARQLHGHVAASGLDMTFTYAKRYVSALRKAGYLATVRPGSPNRMEVFKLKPAMNTGPRAPQIQNIKTVYDPNLNQVMCADDPEELL